jgi:hypothetical protein
MLTTLLVTGCLIFVQPGPNVEAPTAEDNPSDTQPELANQVRRLVRQMDDSQLKQRNDAEEALFELGPAALIHLPSPEERLSAEVKTRLSRVREKLELLQAELFSKSSTVTIEKQTLPLSEVFEQIEQQTGNAIVDYRDQFGQVVEDPKIEVHFDETPFWEALDQVLDQAKLSVYGDALEDGIALVARSPGEAPVTDYTAYAGAFRIQTTEIFAQRQFRYVEGHRLQLTLDVSWEPRLRPVGLLFNEADAEATGDGDRTIEIAGADSELTVPIHDGSTSTQIHLSLAPPPREMKQITQLKGRFTALVPGQIETFRFEKLAESKKVQQKRGGVTVTLNEVRRNNAIWEVRMKVRFDDPAGTLQSHDQWIYENEAALLAPDGNPIEVAGFETFRESMEEIGIVYLFDVEQDLKDHVFQYNTPTKITPIEVQYELKDLPLP